MGFKGPRNMTVILPGMTEDDQRVKISSADPKQQGIMDLWKSKVCLIQIKYLILSCIRLNTLLTPIYRISTTLWNYIIKHPFGMMKPNRMF